MLSGLYQQGYATGYILAALFYLALVPTTGPYPGWRSLFWFGAGPPLLIIVFRLCLPETQRFRSLKAERQDASTNDTSGSDNDLQEKKDGFRSYLKGAAKVLQANWVLFIYMVFLMAGFNFSTHGSQDLYPTYLKTQLGMSPSQVTIITVVGQISCVLGGIVIGYLSSILGRRVSIVCICVLGGALLPSYILLTDMTLVLGAILEQFCVGGAWGPVPIHLQELAPPVLRSLMVGLTYQLGNLASSASATIEATIGERFPLPPTDSGTHRYNYGKVIGIFMATVWVYLTCLVLVGPEMSEEERADISEEITQ